MSATEKFSRLPLRNIGILSLFVASTLPDLRDDA
jgi:hypothetical protein